MIVSEVLSAAVVARRVCNRRASCVDRCVCVSLFPRRVLLLCALLCCAEERFKAIRFYKFKITRC